MHKIGIDYTEIFKNRKKKRDYPYVGKLSKTINIEKIQKTVNEVLDENKNRMVGFSRDTDLASTEHNYALSNKDGNSFVPNYDEIYKYYASIGFQSLSDDAMEKCSHITREANSFTPFERQRGVRLTSSSSYHPIYDERNYTKPTKFNKGEITKLLDGFIAEPCRSALVVLHPGKFLAPHYDCGPEIVARLQIPIFTNPDAVIGFKHGNEWHEYHLPADGSIFFLNSGYEHYAVNNGTESRYQIRVCLNGQEDLAGMEEVLPTKIMSHEEFAKRPESGSYYGKNENNLGEAALTEIGMNKEKYNSHSKTKLD